MRKTVLTVLMTAGLLVGAVISAAGAGGSQSDPLISLSYITQKYLPEIMGQASSRANTALLTKYNAADARLSALAGGYDGRISDAKLVAAVADAAIVKLRESGSSVIPNKDFTIKTLRKGDAVSGGPGTGILLRAGTAALTDKMINLTAGGERAKGAAAGINIFYMVPESGAGGVTITSETASLMVSGSFTVTPAYTVAYTKTADALYSLGLFRGTNLGYELERPATRIEGLIMLIRLLGEERAAESYTGAAHPFTDVPAWAEKYVAYAYWKGYTNGISATLFGSTSETTASHYLTFVLRALGYDDAAGDFVWNQSAEKAADTGLLTEKEASVIGKPVFYRDHVTWLSMRALGMTLKDSGTRLSDKLIEAGVMTAQAYSDAAASVQTP